MEVFLWILGAFVVWSILKGLLKGTAVKSQSKFVLARANMSKCMQDGILPSWAGVRDSEFITNVDSLLSSEHLHVPTRSQPRSNYIAMAGIAAAAMERAGGNFSDQYCFAATTIKMLYAEHGTSFFEDNSS